MEGIKCALKESKKQFVFKGELATKTHLRELMRKGPRVLHLACHGLYIAPRVKEIVKAEFKVGKKDEEDTNYLLFETRLGEHQLVPLSDFN